MRPEPGTAGLSRCPPAFEDFAPTLVRTFRPPSPRSLRVEVHPAVRFTSSSELYDFRPAPDSCRPDLAAVPTRAEAPSLGFPALFATSAGGVHTRTGIPSPCFGPSSAFRTPSTVYATTGLAGLFRPATAYRVRPSGDSPPPGARSGFPNRLALVPLRASIRGFDPVPVTPSTSGPCSPGGCGDGRQRLDRRQFRAPLGLAPPPGALPAHRATHPDLSTGHAASACDLRCDELTAAGPWRLADARCGWRRITLPTRSRFCA